MLSPPNLQWAIKALQRFKRGNGETCPAPPFKERPHLKYDAVSETIFSIQGRNQLNQQHTQGKQQGTNWTKIRIADGIALFFFSVPESYTFYITFHLLMIYLSPSLPLKKSLYFLAIKNLWLNDIFLQWWWQVSFNCFQSRCSSMQILSS